jgi:hypothetical protein
MLPPQRCAVELRPCQLYLFTARTRTQHVAPGLSLDDLRIDFLECGFMLTIVQAGNRVARFDLIALLLIDLGKDAVDLGPDSPFDAGRIRNRRSLSARPASAQ